MSNSEKNMESIITNLTKEDMEMSSEEQEKNNHILKIIISRHGPKASADGEKNDLALYFTDNVKNGIKDIQLDKNNKGLIHLSSSKVKRAKDTANVFEKELKQLQNRLKTGETDNRLTTPYQPETTAKNESYVKDFNTIITMQAKIKDRIAMEIEDEQKKITPIEKEAELRNRIDMEVLSKMFEDEKMPEDEKIFQNPYPAVADDFAQRYKGFFKHLDLLEKQKKYQNKIQPENEPYIHIDISHSFQITCFIKKYLIFEDGTSAKNLSPKEFFERTSGTIRESGSFELDYAIDENGNKRISVIGEFSKGKKFIGKLEL